MPPISTFLKANQSIPKPIYLLLSGIHNQRNHKTKVNNYVAKNGGWVPETSRSFHYWQPAPRWRLLPWLANPGNPTMSPHAVRGTGTHHTVETVERGRETGWEGNCLGDEPPHYKTPENASCTNATLCYATIHKCMELRHVHMCRHRWPPAEQF